MGECTCSKIAIMQLFYELKQQFPTLSDQVVSQCIAQEGHNKETCTRTLRATQERRPSPGAFPPPAPNLEPARGGIIMNQEQVATFSPASNSRPHRPASLDIGLNHRPISCSRVPPINNFPFLSLSSNSGPYCSQEVFDDSNLNAERTGFELNVNVACSPVKNTGAFNLFNENLPRSLNQVGFLFSQGFGSPPVIPRASEIIYEPRPHYTEPYMSVNPSIQGDQTRSFTSVSLTLRPPSSERQPPIDIRSHGSSLTYSTSSSDPRGFQSRVQIRIGPGNVGSVAAARIRPPMAPTRPSSLIPSGQYNSLRRAAGPPSQLSRPTMTMSEPTTPLASAINSVFSPTSLPTTPLAPHVIRSPSSSPEKEKERGTMINELVPLTINQVTERQRQLIMEQIERKERLARDVEAEKERLVAMKKEIEMLLRSFDPSRSPEENKRKLQREIYQLQIECNKLTNEIDQRSDPGVPLGETNEEFYQGIYTGQPFVPRTLNVPPLSQAEPLAWQLPGNRDSLEERDGPSWVCRMCTFDNHPLMKRCEQCELPRSLARLSTGETQDIHIRVTHHHNFSPRRTVHSWVV